MSYKTHKLTEGYKLMSVIRLKSNLKIEPFIDSRTLLFVMSSCIQRSQLNDLYGSSFTKYSQTSLNEDLPERVIRITSKTKCN